MSLKQILLISCFSVTTFFISNNVYTGTSSQLLPTKSTFNTPSVKFAQLKEKARRKGSVRVIVGVKKQDLNKPIKRAIVKPIQSLKALVYKEGIEIKRVLKNQNMLVLKLNEKQLEQFRSRPEVNFIIEDSLSMPALSDSVATIGAVQTHQHNIKGEGQAIAILDTGVDYWHPAFAKNGESRAKVVEQACFSTTDIDLFSESTCPSGEDEQIGHPAGFQCIGATGCGHGTGVASVAAGNPAEDYPGVAPEADIISVQIFSRIIDPEACKGSAEPCSVSFLSDQIRAFEWVLNESTTDNIAVVNFSVGSNNVFSEACNDDVLAPLITELKQKGIATVNASGNSGSSEGVSSPACIDDGITVGSIDNDGSDTISTISNSSALVDLLAPGGQIRVAKGNGNGANEYVVLSGTSYAAPHVSGAIALLKSINNSASVDEIEAILKSTGVDIADPNNGLTFKRIDVGSAADEFRRPIASIDRDSYSIFLGNEQAFSALGSSDPLQQPLSYTWDFGNSDELVSNEPSIQYTYGQTGNYTLKLSVNNGDLSSTNTEEVNVTVFDTTIIIIALSNVLF